MNDVSGPGDGLVRARAGMDAEGQAALLLVESLIHGLVERSVITIEDAIEIVETAEEVMVDLAVDLGTPADSTMALLAAIRQSLESSRGEQPLR